MGGELAQGSWVRLDTQFHLGIAQASGNAVFATIVAAIRGALSVQSRMLNASIPERRTASSREHRKILEAIASGDFADASDCMRQHLDRVEDAIPKLADVGAAIR